MTDNTLSRRTILGGGVALGLAGATAATSAAAQTAAAATGTPTGASDGLAPSLQDPRTRYRSEPFAEQRQEWPGLNSRMDPVPDCGETSYRGSGKLTGRRALVTGGDSGIGRAAVIAFAREGADVAINYLPDEESDAQEVVALVREAGRRAVAIPADIRTQAACEEVVRRAVAELGGLDILVNNAAYQQNREDLTEITDEQFVRTYETNVFHVFRFSKAVADILPPGSAIINTISRNAYDPGIDLIDYASTKGAILNLTKGMAKQFAKRGVRVNAVAPGPIWTPLQVVGGQLPGTMHEFGQETAFGRAGQPIELAALYVALASGETSYSTGTSIDADGGIKE